MEKITLTNQFGDSLTFSDYDPAFNWTFKGDLGSIPIAISTEKGYLQRGTSVIQKTISSKTFVFGVEVRGISLTAFKTNMKLFSRFFDPEGEEMTLKYENTRVAGSKYMTVHVSSTPSILRNRSNHGRLSQRFVLNLFAPIPVWEDESMTETLLESQVDAFVFPIDISDAFIFAEVNDAGVEIDYEGDISTSIIIEFAGLSTNPSIENVTYSEKILLNKTIADGDGFRINTDYNNTEVVEIISGVESGAFASVDPTYNSLNMTLRRGINLIKYTSDDTSRTSAVLKYKNKWLTPYSGVVD